MDRAVGAAQHQSVERREQRARHARALIADVALDRDGAIQVAQQELWRADQVKLKILFQNAYARIRRHRESHGRRIDESGNVAETQTRTSGGQLHVPILPRSEEHTSELQSHSE